MKKISGTIKAILFDFGGTIDSDGLNWKDHFYPIYRACGVPWNKDKFDECFYYADDTLVDRALKELSLRSTLHLQVSLVLRKGSLYSESLRTKIADQFLKDVLKVIQRNKPLFRKLKKKYRLGIVSNFYGNLETICSELGLTQTFTAIADSANVGAIKPSSKIFSYVLDQFECKPSEALFIGDSLTRDMHGAKKMGMPHIWLRHETFKKMKPCCKQDKIITSLTELNEILL